MSFKYPNYKITRTQSPPEYTSYKPYKRWLRREFSRKCVYCQDADTLDRHDKFGVDHYRPQSQFPELAAAYSNLFYCCNTCNSRKKNFWPSKGLADPSSIPNPCDFRMTDHLRFQREQVVASSTHGNTAIELLDLNAPDRVAYRDSLLVAEASMLKTLASNAAFRKKVATELRLGKRTLAVAEAILSELDANDESLNRALAEVQGTTPIR
jgi:uncharacterized protein (TIGR02646 family)